MCDVDADEAVRCVDEQVIRSVRDGDIVRYLALVFRHFSVDRSAISISRRGRSGCNNATTGHAVWFRFTPCERLVEMSKRGESFWKQLQLTCNKKVKAI